MSRANLPSATGLAKASSDTVHQMPDSSFIRVTSNWRTLEDQPLTRASIRDLFENTIPTIRHEKFLSKEECQKSVEVIKTHQIGSYNEKIVFPRVGSVGITQFDHKNDKSTYFKGVDEANTLQNRLRQEGNIDILGYVAALLQKTTGLTTRIAREGDQEYFAGLLRAVDNYIQIHPDYGPYDGPDWEIGSISSQLTWNVLLKRIHGGDTIIYDRQWQGVQDDAVFQKAFPRYAYAPTGIQGCIFKALQAVEGDLTFFNSRNFHEVKPCDQAWDRPEEVVRYTMSSFVGLLPRKEDSPPCLILWS